MQDSQLARRNRVSNIQPNSTIATWKQPLLLLLGRVRAKSELPPDLRACPSGYQRDCSPQIALCDNRSPTAIYLSLGPRRFRYPRD